jgi:hypothetical protein
VRHSLNIIVAMLSMAAGAWQGTTAQTESSRPATRQDQVRKAAAPVTLRGCLRRGATAGAFLLKGGTSTLAADSTASATRPPSADGLSAPSTEPAVADTATTMTYELVAATPDLDLAAFVGRRVETQGSPERTASGATADDSPTVSATAADSPSTTSPAGTSGQVAQRSRVRVTTIHAVDGACE